MRVVSVSGKGFVKDGFSQMGRAMTSALNQVLEEHMMPGDLLAIKELAKGWYMTKDVDKRVETELLYPVVKPKGGRMIIFSDWPLSYAPLSSDQPVIQKLVNRHKESGTVRMISLEAPFCSKFAIEHAENVTNGTNVAGCSGGLVPGTDGVSAYLEEYDESGVKLGHLSPAGEVFLWPYVCDAIEALLEEWSR